VGSFCRPTHESGPLFSSESDSQLSLLGKRKEEEGREGGPMARKNRGADRRREHAAALELEAERNAKLARKRETGNKRKVWFSPIGSTPMIASDS
jgi:hypothetical protein